MSEKNASQPEQVDADDQPLGPLVVRPPRRIGLVIGGAMTLTAGILAIANALNALFQGAAVTIGPDTGEVNIAACGIIVLFLGAVAILGGAFALMKKHISLALAGAAAGMMGGGDPGFWLGLFSLLLFAFSDVDI